MRKKNICENFFKTFFETCYITFYILFVGFDDVKIAFQILTVKHYFSKKCTKDLEPNNHAGFGTYLFSIRHKKAEKGIAG